MSLETIESVIAGGPDDFVEARHLVLRGTNREIGRALGEIARERFRAKPLHPPDPMRARATRRYFHEHYPIHEQRVLGAQDVYGNTDRGIIGLPYLMPLPGCSVAYIPPARSAIGGGLFSRYYDFPLELGVPSTDAERLGPSASPVSPGLRVASRPYVIEVYPDEGYPSLYFCQYDLLGGCTDGINSEGLTVSILADDETPALYPTKPMLTPGIGIGPVGLPRFLLDTCADVDEAKEALLMTKQYGFFIPAHYIVADRHGNSFVWEYSPIHYREHIVDGGGETQVVTNHLLHQPAPARVSVGNDPGWTRTRFDRLRQAVMRGDCKLSIAELRDAHSSVRFTKAFAREVTGDAAAGDSLGARTIWHSLYDIDARRVEVSFYLGDTEDGDDRRSEYRSFELTEN